MFSGCYDAGRAAALSGVPKSTVYYWAREHVVVPSISPVQEKLWSYGDLIALRMVSWLRHRKEQQGELAIQRSPMPLVRRALALLDEHGVSLWDSSESRSPLLVDVRGRIYVRLGDEIVDLDGAKALPKLETFGLTEPFSVGGAWGPNLIQPREHLRIIPGRVSGEPHVLNTRITSLALAALSANGLDPARIAEWYDIDDSSVRDAISLEEQLGTLPLSAA